jgi:hypothetical protein
VKKTKIAVLANVLAIAIVIGVNGLANAKSLAALAGKFAGEGSAAFAVCYNSDFSKVVDCKDAASTAFWNQTSVSQGTAD